MNSSTVAQLTDRKLLLVLAYSPAGLGHLRVTDALYHGLPETVNPVVLGSQDRSIQSMQRLTSVNPLGDRDRHYLLGSGRPDRVPAAGGLLGPHAAGPGSV
jgi:hypothetical protein